MPQYSTLTVPSPANTLFLLFKLITQIIYLLLLIAYNFLVALSGVILLLPAIILQFTKMFLQSKLFARLARKFFKLSVAISATVIFGKLALFGYYKFQGQQENANAQKTQALSLGNKLLDFCKSNALNFVKQIAIGMVVATLTLTTYITFLMACRAAATHFWPEYNTGPDKDYDDDTDYPSETFMDVVIFAPILEEIMYRGIIYPTLKLLFQKLYNYCYPPKTNAILQGVQSTTINVQPDVSTQQTQVNTIGQRTTINQPNNVANFPQELAEPKFVTYATNIGTSFMFMYPHSNGRRPYAFVGGLASGWLKENYGLTACVTEHMANNGIAYGLSHVLKYF